MGLEKKKQETLPYRQKAANPPKKKVRQYAKSASKKEKEDIKK